MIEMPSKWWDMDSPIGLVNWTVKQKFEALLRERIEKVVSDRVNEMEVPDIKINQNEVKDRMLDILAYKALRERESEERE